MAATSRHDDDQTAGGTDRAVTTVAIAHASRMVTDGLAALLEHQPALRVVRTDCALPTFPLDDDATPDVVILDPTLLPDPGALRGLTQRRNGPKVLLIADAGDAAGNVRLLAEGAVGLVDHRAGASSVAHAVLAAVHGLGVAPVSHIGLAARRLTSAFGTHLEALEDDELRLWRDVADGRDYATIAERHFVSERTARRHVDALLERLGVENRFQAAELAGRAFLDDFLPDDDPED